MALKPFEIHEKEVQESLGLRSTLASGSQWQDISDGVDPDPDSPLKLMVDAKCTEGKGYSVTYREMAQWDRRAGEAGYQFGLPLRFLGSHEREQKDYIVVSLSTFSELLSLVKDRPVEEVEGPPPPLLDDTESEFLWQVVKAIEAPGPRSQLIDIITKLEEHRG